MGGLLKRPAAILALAAIALGEAGVIYHLVTTGGLKQAACVRQSQLDLTTRDRDAWRQLGEAGADRVTQLRADRRAAQAAVSALQADLADAHTASAARVQRTRDAPDEDDGPVAPVLRQAIEAIP